MPSRPRRPTTLVELEEVDVLPVVDVDRWRSVGSYRMIAGRWNEGIITWPSALWIARNQFSRSQAS